MSRLRAWPDLVGRTFPPATPNQLWCADLKQILIGESVLLLASVLDCFSRKIVGWQIGPGRRRRAGRRRRGDGRRAPTAGRGARAPLRQ